MKTINLKSLLVLIAVGLLFGSCQDEVIPSGNITTENYDFSGYSNLDLSGIIDATVEFSTTEESIEIITDDNIQEYIKVKQSGNTLKIYIDDLSINGPADIKAVIKTANISGYDLSGASKVSLENTLTTETVSLDLSGVSKFSGAINSTTFSVDLSGASKVTVTGSTDNFTADLSGDSQVGSYDFEAKKIIADLSGVSEISTTITDEIIIEASGVSELNYKGNPTITLQDLSGLSKLNKID